jgi:hypothetical protein
MRLNVRPAREALQQGLRGRSEPRGFVLVFPMRFAIIGDEQGDFHGGMETILSG